MKNTLKQRRPKELTVTISRTIQIKQYEPVHVTVTEIHELENDENIREVRLQVYNQVSTAVARFMNKELERYSEE